MSLLDVQESSPQNNLLIVFHQLLTRQQQIHETIILSINNIFQSMNLLEINMKHAGTY